MKSLALRTALLLSAVPILAANDTGGSMSSSPSMSAPGYDPAAEYQNGLNALKAHRYADAKKSFMKVYPAASRDPMMNTVLGVTLMGLDDYKGAQKYLEKAVKLDSKSIVDVIQKGNVSGLDSSSFALTEPGKSFFETLTPTSILSKLTGARRVPLLTRCITFDSGSTGYSATEGKAVPISAAALSGDTVEPRHHVGIVVATNELLRTPGSETALARDLARAVTAAENASFLATVAGGILFGGSTQASAGATLTNIDTDVAFAVGALITAGSTLENAVWICSPVNAAALAAKRGTGGGPAFPDVRYDGGRLAGIPLITSTSAGNLLILLDLDNIVIAEGGGVQLSTSSVTSLEMLDDVPAVPPAIGAA